MKILMTALTAIAVTCWAISSMAEPAPDNGLENIAARIADIRSQSGMASAYLLMVDKHQILLHKGFGIRAWDDPRPITDQDYYRLGSISKAFTGLALLKAEQQGCLKLTDPVRKLAPEALYTNRWEQTHPLTVAMLMEHTAGWFDMSWFEFKYNEPLSLTQGLKLRPDSRVAQWPPGLHYSYSNSGPGMAGWVLEQACKVDFDRYIQNNVFAPLDMSSATMNRTAEVAQDLVGGYNSNPKEPIRYWNFLFRPSGSMNVRPIQMTHFLQLMLNRGMHNGKQVFSDAQIERMETPTTTARARAGMQHGYGLGIRASLKNGHTIYGHGGDADGYLTRFSYSKDSGRAFFVVITMFDNRPLNKMRAVLEDWLVEDLPKPSPPVRVVLSKKRIDEIVGQYRLASVRFPQGNWQQKILTLRWENSWLEYQTGSGNWRKLVPVTDQMFRFINQPTATVGIVTENNKTYFQYDNRNWEKLGY